MEAKTIHRLLEMSYDTSGKYVFNRNEFELLDELTLDDNLYLALIPLDGDEDEYVVLKVETDEIQDVYVECNKRPALNRPRPWFLW